MADTESDDDGDGDPDSDSDSDGAEGIHRDFAGNLTREMSADSAPLLRGPLDAHIDLKAAMIEKNHLLQVHCEGMSPVLHLLRPGQDLTQTVVRTRAHGWGVGIIIRGCGLFALE